MTYLRTPKGPNGSTVIPASIGDSSGWIEFEYSPGDPGQTSGPPERCWPPEPEELHILAASLDGSQWMDADLFRQDVIDGWEQAAFSWLEKQRDSDLADRAESRARDREEY